MRVIVCGTREADCDELVYSELTALWEGLFAGEILTVVHGACPNSADEYAEAFARSPERPNVQHEPHPADWDRYGKRAGFIRNKHMASLGGDRCLAFWDGTSTGTLDMIRCAAKAKIRTEVIPVSLKVKPFWGRVEW